MEITNTVSSTYTPASCSPVTGPMVSTADGPAPEEKQPSQPPPSMGRKATNRASSPPPRPSSFPPRSSSSPPPPNAQLGGLVALSAAMRQVLSLLIRVAPTELTVTLIGETGTGKDVLAHAIHDNSSRASGP